MKLIVEMEMKNRCIDCQVRLACKRYIEALQTMDGIEEMEKNIGSHDCLIKGVLPEQHGDLIDRDAYLKLLGSYIESKRGVCENKEFVVALQTISKQIKCVKAVIAAERSKHGTTAD